MKGPKEISKQEITEGFKEFLTVGKLKDFLAKHDLPDDAKVLVERLEDRYFENNNWPVYIKPGEMGLNQYHPVWSGVHYKDDKDILFLDVHY